MTVMLLPFLLLWAVANRAFAHSDSHDTQHPGMCASSFGPNPPENFAAKDAVAPAALELVPLLVSGDSANRIDLVFFGDGYVQEERSKFLADSLRLAEDVSRNHTFYTVQPLLNFWAAFTPSKESGLGIGGPKDTVYGLYRQRTELRGVYYAYGSVARAACRSLGNQCDYPILLGNDPRYGGLGGEFTVTTSSIINGAIVLRHELGHSILDVGEEYDGGQVYSGNNAASSPSGRIPWRQWFTDPARVDANGNPKVERSMVPLQAYPWTLLNTTRPWSVRFNSPGTYTRYQLQFSISGIVKKEDLKVSFDGRDLGWVPRADIGDDRWFYDFDFKAKLERGAHEFKFELTNKSLEGSAQLCSLEVLEYGNEEEFKSAPGFYGLYPTFDINNRTTYRPTNEDCLMRKVTSPSLCKVCVETLWTKLLGRISLIDGIKKSCVHTPDLPHVFVTILDLQLLPIAHLREVPVEPKESYTITWRKDGVVQERFANQTNVAVESSLAIGRWTANVKFATEEVRVTSADLEDTIEYVVDGLCTV